MKNHPFNDDLFRTVDFNLMKILFFSSQNFIHKNRYQTFVRLVQNMKLLQQSSVNEKNLLNN